MAKNPYEGLDRYQLEQIKAEMERQRAKYPGAVPPTAEEAAAAAAEAERNSTSGAIKRAMSRTMENLARFGKGATWLGREALKLPGTLVENFGAKGDQNLSGLITGKEPERKAPLEKLGYKPLLPVTKLKRAAEGVGKDIDSAIDYWEAAAGKPKEEHIYPTGERLIPTWVPETLGHFVEPGPILSPIKKLFAKEALKPMATGAAKMGAYSGAVSGMEELNKPADKREWSNVPINMAAGAALSPLVQRMQGAWQNRGIKPANENPLGVELPDMDMPKAPAPGPKAIAPPVQKAIPPAAQPRQIPDYTDVDPLTVPLGNQLPEPHTIPGQKQITDFTDVPFEEIRSSGELPHIPTRSLDYTPEQGPVIHAPGPVATGPGTKIEMPGPVYQNPPNVDDLVAKQRPPLGFKPDESVPMWPDPGSPAPPTRDISIPSREKNFVPDIGEPPVRTSAVPGELPPLSEADFKKSLKATGKAPSSPVEAPDLLSMPPTASQPHSVPTPKPVTASAVYGDSLTDFLRSRGGVLDQGGEIGRLEVPGRPFQKGLIQENGLDLDTAAEIAHEAGYIKNRDINELLNALDMESRGKPTFGLDAPIDPTLEDQFLGQAFKDERPFIDPADAEFHLTPEEPIHPSDLPEDFLPPLDDAWPDPTIAHGDPAPVGHSNVSAQNDDFLQLPESNRTELQLERPGVQRPDELFAVPPETIGSRPIIGREATPDEAPLFSQSAQLPEAEQHKLFSTDLPGPPVPDHPSGIQAAREVAEETKVDTEELNGIRNLLNDERGHINIGGGIDVLERVLTQRRFAEMHPKDFGPVYDMAQQRAQWSAAQKYDLTQLGKPYFLLDPKDRAIVDQFLRDRRRNFVMYKGQPITVNPNLTIPQYLQPAVNALDRMFASAMDLVDDVRATKGLPPMKRDLDYVPFARSGDYLTIATLPNNQKWVSASNTLREAEEVMKGLQAKHPGITADVKMGKGRKGDVPTLDFGTLALLERAGFIDRMEFDDVVKKFDLPPGFNEHFRNAQKILGESTDLMDPISRYIDGLTTYAGRFLHDEPMKDLIEKITDTNVQNYARSYREYLNTKPQEFSRLRGAVAVWDMALNVGSIFQNTTQVPLVGFPTLQKHIGIGKATKVFKDGIKAMLHPTPDDLTILALARREGHITPVNAEELFGARGGPKQSIELGAPFFQNMVESGNLPQWAGDAARVPLNLASKGLDNLGGAIDQASLKLGQKVSYGVHRLTGSSAPIAADKAQSAHPILMQGFAALEEKNRELAILQGFRAGQELGLGFDEAYEFAKKFSRDVNFDYSPVSRAQAFRGMGAPLGLFMTFQTEYMATISKFVRENKKAAGTALAAFWTIGGMKGMPGVEDLDLYGPEPGMLSENLPDWAYHGPLSAGTGLDISAKFKVGPRVPYDLLHGEFDPSQVAAIQPFVNALQGTDWFMDQPKDGPTTQKYIERLLPPAARHAAQSARWSGMGPAGNIENGMVSTLRGHTPGPTADGKRELYPTTPKDRFFKALTFTPLELSKQYTRGRIQQQLKDRQREQSARLTNTVLHHLDVNGLNVPHPAIERLKKEHPRTWAEIQKAHTRKLNGVEKGSTEQIYRKMQEPKVIKQ